MVTSDYDTSWSSISALNSSHSSISDLSSVSLRSSSVSYSDASFSLSKKSVSLKPHKANQAAWEAMREAQMVSGQVGLDSFRLLKRLGSGDIGIVYLCRLRPPLPEFYYAMKVVDREALVHRNKLQRAKVEGEILGVLDHPFLPTLYAQFEVSHYSCLVMEYCPGGDLLSLRQRQPSRRFTISAARFYAAEVLLALEYLHMMGVVFRDLKPENVLVRGDGHIMLSDFDLSLKCDVVPKLLLPKPSNPLTTNTNAKTASSCALPLQPMLTCFSSNEKNANKNKKIHGLDFQAELVVEPLSARSKSFVGTHEYLAPEVISGLGHGSAVDWWTFGVFLYELLYGKTPFRGESNEKTLMNIMKKPLGFPNMISIDNEGFSEARDLISRLLAKNPKKRIGSALGSVEIKKHGFFRGVNWALIRSVKPPQVPNEQLRLNKENNRMVAKNVRERQRKRQGDLTHQMPPHFEYF
ncbi:hypothetical protein AMTRI_Chr05g62350 [Amborella trichopoda]|uniref:non-specific serine/threonine protein kinase n=1 Tax=Amborella trichopoda TaxID=13333 RepID=W1PA53_AMBTC|nr:protein kinase PINOID 2 [Amborella trichopoda]ERN04491.1 hypothetical protein AMTR_s00081p00063880 [Amborella trichopoda]|eukprot:XP_006842816.1 protein kinase PINOID 2 [Amborella trichopoda]